VKFTDTDKQESKRYSIRRLDFILAGAGHLLILVIGLIAFSSSAQTPSGGDDAIMVTMVTAASAEDVAPSEITAPAEITAPVEVAEEAIQELVPAEIPEEEIIEELEVEEHPEDPVEEHPEEVDQQEIPVELNPAEETFPVEEGFASVTGEGSAGTGAPGPGTYESRVFNAVRREYRTSAEPEQSYRIIMTVEPDGTTSIEVIRKSGTSAFDRAVENALAMAQIPPMPPGRSNSAVINIEFIGAEAN